MSVTALPFPCALNGKREGFFGFRSGNTREACPYCTVMLIIRGGMRFPPPAVIFCRMPYRDTFRDTAEKRSRVPSWIFPFAFSSGQDYEPGNASEISPYHPMASMVSLFPLPLLRINGNKPFLPIPRAAPRRIVCTGRPSQDYPPVF
jgi:hypothetical protein